MTPTISIAELSEGQATLLKINDVAVLLCNVDGNFHAVEGWCTHARQSLAAGRLRGSEIACPLHGARFDVRTGACLAPPAQVPLRRFPVMIENGKVCVDVT